jgi:outer membrane immunogenic protein
VGGRLGYLAWDTLLVFMSGGYTQANFKNYTGWFLGGGYEYRFDWLPGLYWKTEYRFSTFNKKDIQLLADGVPEPEAFVHSEKFIQTVTSSLVWRFNWWR